MKTRPCLSKGDLVKFTHRFLRNESWTAKVNRWDKDTILRVCRVVNVPREALRLRVNNPDSSEGFVKVQLVDKSNRRFEIRRRHLWRIPNQPRYKIIGSDSSRGI